MAQVWCFEELIAEAKDQSRSANILQLLYYNGATPPQHQYAETAHTSWSDQIWNAMWPSDGLAKWQQRSTRWLTINDKHTFCDHSEVLCVREMSVDGRLTLFHCPNWECQMQKWYKHVDFSVHRAQHSLFFVLLSAHQKALEYWHRQTANPKMTQIYRNNHLMVMAHQSASINGRDFILRFWY